MDIVIVWIARESRWTTYHQIHHESTSMKFSISRVCQDQVWNLKLFLHFEPTSSWLLTDLSFEATPTLETTNKLIIYWSFKETTNKLIILGFFFRSSSEATNELFDVLPQSRLENTSKLSSAKTRSLLNGSPLFNIVTTRSLEPLMEQNPE